MGPRPPVPDLDLAAAAAGPGHEAARPPAIVLVRPQLGQNIGMVARAMGNAGLTRLVLVAPRDGWPNPAAWAPAVGAHFILEQAQVAPSLAEAVAPFQSVYATTARRRARALRHATPGQLAETLLQTPDVATCVLFGPENNGLTDEELRSVNGLVTIPVHPSLRSINVAQAVWAVAHSWFLAASCPRPSFWAVDSHEPAAKSQLDHFLKDLLGRLEARDYFRSGDAKEELFSKLCAVFQRAEASTQEVQLLYGVVAALSRPAKNDR